MDLNLKFLLSGYQFQVILDKIPVSFSKVSNLEMEAEYEEYQEGGTNDRVLLFKKPKSKADVLKLERGVWNLELMKLEPGMRLKNITIMVLHHKIPVKTYAIDEGIIRKVSVSELDAMKGGAIIESVEIIHTGLEPVKIM